MKKLSAYGIVMGLTVLFSLQAFGRESYPGPRVTNDYVGYICQDGDDKTIETVKDCVARIKEWSHYGGGDNTFLHLDRLRKKVRASWTELGTSLTEMKQTLQIGYASEACKHWRKAKLESVENTVSPLWSKYRFLEEERASFFEMAEKAGPFHRCQYDVKDWENLKKSIEVKFLTDRACEGLHQTFRSKSVSARDENFAYYQKAIDKLKAKNLVDQLPDSCKISSEKARALEMAPYHNQLMDSMDAVNRSLAQLEKAKRELRENQEKVSNSVKAYNRHGEEMEGRFWLNKPGQSGSQTRK